MKHSKLYVILFVAITIVFAVIGLLVTKISIDNIKIPQTVVWRR